jgi:hypothetical protein
LSDSENEDNLSNTLEKELEDDDRTTSQNQFEWTDREGFSELQDTLLHPEEKEEEIDWSKNKFGHGWEPIKYNRLKCDDMSKAQKWLEALKERHKTGIRINLTKAGIERHEIGIDRVLYLLKYYPMLSNQGLYYMYNVHLDKCTHTIEEYERYVTLDNPKKYQYRLDLYIYRWRNATKKDKTMKGLIHYDRHIVEIDGGYHDKWRQMMKDEWRDIDTQVIFPDAKIIRFPVDELVPENMDLNRDTISTDYDVARKILNCRDYFSTPFKSDIKGKPFEIGKNILRRKNYFDID